VRVPALSGRRRLTGRLVLSSHLSHDEEEKDDVGLVLLTSHLSHDVARPALLLLLLLPSEELLLASQCSAASARQGLGGDLVGALLHASHLSTASARLGFGGEGAAAQGGCREQRQHLPLRRGREEPGHGGVRHGEVHSRHRHRHGWCSGWIEGEERSRSIVYSYTNQERGSGGDGMRLMAGACGSLFQGARRSSDSELGFRCPSRIHVTQALDSDSPAAFMHAHLRTSMLLCSQRRAKLPPRSTNPLHHRPPPTCRRPCRVSCLRRPSAGVLRRRSSSLGPSHRGRTCASGPNHSTPTNYNRKFV
jgi:hypothetical protein